MVNRVVQHHRTFLEEDDLVEHALHIRDEVRGQQDRGCLLYTSLFCSFVIFYQSVSHSLI